MNEADALTHPYVEDIVAAKKAVHRMRELSKNVIEKLEYENGSQSDNIAEEVREFLELSHVLGSVIPKIEAFDKNTLPCRRHY